MLYPELFKSLESARWDMDKDVPWDGFDASLLSDECGGHQAHGRRRQRIADRHQLDKGIEPARAQTGPAAPSGGAMSTISRLARSTLKCAICLRKP